MSADDIYRYALDKVAPPDEIELEEFDPEDAPEDWRKYHHISYKAHYEELCTGDHKIASAPWPEGGVTFTLEDYPGENCDTLKRKLQTDLCPISNRT